MAHVVPEGHCPATVSALPLVSHVELSMSTTSAMRVGGVNAEELVEMADTASSISLSTVGRVIPVFGGRDRRRHAGLNCSS